MDKPNDLMEKLVSLCKRRGFIFQSSEIYGGLNGCWDYGPLGVELKRNVKNLWWQNVVTSRDDMVGLDAAVIMNPKVWEASGHVGGFADPMVTCKNCKKHMREDHLDLCALCTVPSIPETDFDSEAEALDRFEPNFQQDVFLLHQSSSLEEIQSALRRHLGSKRAKLTVRGAVIFAKDGNKSYLLERKYPAKKSELLEFNARCPYCGGELTEPRKFNLMFRTHCGAMEDSSSVAYLRPETAQGIFVNFKNILDTQRLKLPFGIAQIGKAFRNEINPRNYTFRSREFEMMEIEFFCHPSQADQWYQYWRKARLDWYVNLGLRSDRLRLRDHEDNELAHYAVSCADIEYAFPFGVSELEGVANRTDFDLKQHQECAGKDLTYYDDQTKERFLPYVIEPSAGVDRSVLAFLCEAYTEDEAPDDKGNPQKRVLMKLHPKLAPIKAAVFPLVKKDTMPEVAHRIYDDLKKRWNVFYDEKGAIGRRYRRQDEAGTPFCITVDGQTLQDQTATIRDRDSLKQDRVAIDKITNYLSEHLGN
ncbi:Glycine--tRNA ligase [subsurface metagenome]